MSNIFWCSYLLKCFAQQVARQRRRSSMFLWMFKLVNFLKVQKVNSWKATLGGVHLQKIENQVGFFFFIAFWYWVTVFALHYRAVWLCLCWRILAKRAPDENKSFDWFCVFLIIVCLFYFDNLSPQCLEVLSRLEYPLLGQGVAGVKQQWQKRSPSNVY